MEKNTKYLLALTMLGIIGSIGLASASGLGFVNSEQRTTIQQAIENNDFEAWKSAVTSTLTQENFDKLVERHKSMSERMELKNALQQAIENKDYQAYAEAAEKLASTNIMTEEEFNAAAEQGFVPMHGLGHQMGHMGFGGHHMQW